MLDWERLELLNKLCKTCGQHRVIPTSMHIPDCSEDSVEIESGGFLNVSRGMHEGRQVAIRVVRAYVTSDLDVIRGVSIFPAPLCMPKQLNCRDSAKRGSPGSISSTPTSYRCSE